MNTEIVGKGVQYLRTYNIVRTKFSPVPITTRVFIVHG